MFWLNVKLVFSFFTSNPDLSLADSFIEAFISFSDTKAFFIVALMLLKLRCVPSKFGYGFSKSLSMTSAPLLMVISSALILSGLALAAAGLLAGSLLLAGCKAGITFITKEG